MDKRITECKIDFEFLKEDSKILAVLLFGSQASSDYTSRRNTDICIIAPNIQDIKKRALFFKKIYVNVDVFGKCYDVWQFEELALYMKMDVIRNHEVIYCKDLPELHEYFYFFRKLWNDQKYRQELSEEELIKLI